MRIQKVSNEKSLSVFDVISSQHKSLKDREPEMKKPVQKIADRSWEEESPAARLEHNTPDVIDLARKGNSIRSARCAADGITNEGGSAVASSSGKNSIFDSEVLSRLASEQTNKEKTQEEKTSSAQLRSQKAAEWKASSQPQIGESEAEFVARNDSSIRSAFTGQNSKQWVPQNSISMFDNSDFERVQKSAGEEISPRQSSKDDSWRKAKKASTFQQRQSDMVDDLSSEAQDNGYRSQHQDATDRLFDIFKGNQEG